MKKPEEKREKNEIDSKIQGTTAILFGDEEIREVEVFGATIIFVLLLYMSCRAEKWKGGVAKSWRCGVTLAPVSWKSKRVWRSS